MLLHLLTPDEQVVFFRIAQLVTDADGELSEAEVDLLSAAAVEADIGELPPAALGVADAADQLAALAGTPVARAMLFEIAALAVVDGLHDREQGLLSKISLALGVAEPEMARILDVAQRTIAVQQEALEIVSEGA